MSEEYERTISGLLKKRSEMVGELHGLRERMGVVTNDLQCVDRVLQAFGYDGNLEELPVNKGRLVMFHKSEMQQHILHELRRAVSPLSSRDLSVLLVTSEGRDRYDKRLLLDIVKRVGKCLGTLRKRGLVMSCRDSKGRFLWRSVAAPKLDSTK
jgi:hypothetical protein